MEVLILLIFVSLVLAAAAVAFFVITLRSGSHEHTDRLALLPIEPERTTADRDDSTVPRSPS
ncbi:MAG: cbb3-type cytochrome oxidase assembly protein CcoS [Sandaracinaceae bacterium]|nr:cbb3-type cytochrome oxidase assembly protein CcoS [Sandaracinaceae bacterium]